MHKHLLLFFLVFTGWLTHAQALPLPGAGGCCINMGCVPTMGGSGTGGNPIHLVSGNKYQTEIDMPALPGILGLELVRHYNSQYSKPHVATAALGRGWKLSYESELFDIGATLQMDNATAIDLTSTPILHDKSNAMRQGDPNTEKEKLICSTTETTGYQCTKEKIFAEDRQVNGATSGTTQREMGFNNNSMTNAQTHQFITYRPRDLDEKKSGSAQDSTKMGNNTGTVNMKEYVEWVNKNYYKPKKE